MLPLSRVYLNALDTRLKNTRSIFSTSMARLMGVSPSGASRRSLMSRLRASCTNDSVQSFTVCRKFTSVRCSLSFPFSYFRKSRIWLMRRCRIRTFLSAIFVSTFCEGVRLEADASCATGSAIRVRGVRRSCDTFVKNMSFDCVASSSLLLRSCSWSRCSASWSRCSSSSRF